MSKKSVQNIIVTSFVTGLLFGLVVVFASVAKADNGQTPCPTQYGSGQYGNTPCPQNVSVNKQIRNPITGAYVENLLSGDATYSPRSEVVYSLKISNSSNATMSSVLVTDTLPQELKDGKVVDPNQVVEENYNGSSRVLTFKINDLKAGETRDIVIKATVVDSIQAPEGKDKKCEVKNHVKVEAAGQTGDEDTAELCIQTQVLGKSTLPKAGVEDVLPMLPFMGMGISGVMLLLKKKAA